jgi:hypothetical protein
MHGDYLDCRRRCLRWMCRLLGQSLAALVVQLS